MKLKSIFLLPFFILLILSSINSDKIIYDLSLIKNNNSIMYRYGYSFILLSQNKIRSNTISREVKSFEGSELILNQKLTGLSIINKNAIDPYKKYGLDFSTICYCNSPSIYIDTKTKKFIVFNYCDSDKSLKNIENKSVFKIVKIKNELDKIVITTSTNLIITMTKKDKFPIFYMNFKGDFPTKFVGGDLKKVYTSAPEKFQKEDCGDFDG